MNKSIVALLLFILNQLERDQLDTQLTKSSDIALSLLFSFLKYLNLKLVNNLYES